MPDASGREAILKVHTRRMKVEDPATLRTVAEITPGEFATSGGRATALIKMAGGGISWRGVASRLLATLWRHCLHGGSCVAHMRPLAAIVKMKMEPTAINACACYISKYNRFNEMIKICSICIAPLNFLCGTKYVRVLLSE